MLTQDFNRDRYGYLLRCVALRCVALRCVVFGEGEGERERERERERADSGGAGGRMNIHVGKDGTVRDVDFK